MHIQRVSYADLIEWPAIAEYAAECAIPEMGPANPQPAIYARMENVGIFQAFGAFYNMQLAGFATVLTPVLPHYGKKMATIESFFVSKTYRRYGVGRELMKAVEKYSQEAGCAGILYSAPANGKLERLLGLCKKYRRTNSVFFRGF